MSDLTRILAENQKEILKLISPTVKKSTIPQNLGDTESETENTHPVSTSTPIKSKATTFKTTPIKNRNNAVQQIERKLPDSLKKCTRLRKKKTLCVNKQMDLFV